MRGGGTPLGRVLLGRHVLVALVCWEEPWEHGAHLVKILNHLAVKNVHATRAEAGHPTVIHARHDVPVVHTMVQHDISEDHANTPRR